MNRRDISMFIDSPQGIREYEASLANYTFNDLDEGYNNPDPDTPNPGTTTPEVPVLALEAAFRGFILRWDNQSNLTNFDKYEVQVSDDNFVTAYALGFSGADWKGVLDATMDWYTELLVHSGFPFDGTAETPVTWTLYYRVKRMTKLSAESAWSNVATATNLLVDTGDIAANSVTTNKTETGFLQALFAQINELAVGYLGAGSFASPVEGDSTLLIDDARMFLQKYLDGGWSDVNKISFGVLVGASLLSMIGCRGIIHPDASATDLAELIPNENFHLLTLETDYADQNGLVPDSTTNALRSSTWAKFGAWSLYATAAAATQLQYDDVVGLTSNLGAGMWINITNAGASSSTLFAYRYQRDASNYLSIIVDTGGGKHEVIFREVIGGGTQQQVTLLSAADVATGEHYIAFVVDFDNRTLDLIVDGIVTSTTFAALTLTEGATTANYFLVQASSLSDPNLTVYADDILFAYDDLCVPDLFVQHYLSNVAWSTAFAYSDLVLKAAPDGKIMLENTLLESSVLSAVQAGAGIVEQGSNSNGEYRRFSSNQQRGTIKRFELPFSGVAACVATWTFPEPFTVIHGMGGSLVPPTDTAGASTVASAATPSAADLGPVHFGVFNGLTSVEVRVARITGATDFVAGDSLYVTLWAEGEG